VFLACVIPILVTYRTHRPPRLAAAACAVAVLIYADSRTGMIAAAAVGAAATLTPAAMRRLAPPTITALALTAFIYKPISGAVNWALETGSAAAPWLVRPTLNRRNTVWDSALTHYYERTDWLPQMIGWGVGGHRRSDAVSWYWEPEMVAGSRDTFSPHNSTLQTLFDGGWLTVAIFTITLTATAYTLTRQPTTLGLAALLALMITGTTGVGLAPGGGSETWWLLAAAVTIAWAKEPTDTESATHDRIPGRRDQRRPDPHRLHVAHRRPLHGQRQRPNPVPPSSRATAS
jgi:hypothetical protein